MSELFGNTSMSSYNNRIQLWNLNGNGIDTQALLDAELQMVALQTSPYVNQKKYFEQEQNVWKEIKTSLATFTESMMKMTKMTSSDRMTALFPEGFATASSSNQAIEGDYTFSIQQLAQRHKMASDSQLSATESLGYEETVFIGEKELTITSDMSLNDIAKTVNQGDYEAKAVVISGTIVFTAKNTGESNQVQLRDTGQGSKVMSSDRNVVRAEKTGEVAPGSGTYQFEVHQLATAQRVTSNQGLSYSEALGKNGNMTIGNVTVQVESEDTLTDVIEKINATEDGNVRAAKKADGSLVFESVGTGENAAFDAEDTSGLLEAIGMVDGEGFFQTKQVAENASYTVNGVSKSTPSNQDTSIQGLTVSLLNVTDEPVTVSIEGGNVGVFHDLGLLTSDNRAKNVLQEGQLAKYTIDGIPLTSETNTIQNVMTGVTMELKRVTETPVSMTITKNNEDIKEQVGTFVKDYNKAIQKLNQFTGEKALLQGSSLLNRLKMQLTSSLTKPTEDGAFLYEIGIEIDGTLKNGTITFDETKLASVLANDPTRVFQLFSEEGGPGRAIYQFMNDATKATGGLESKISGIQKSIQGLNDKLDKSEQQFEQRKQMLVKKYAMYEMTMSSLQSQLAYMEASLSGLTGSKS